MRLWQKDANKKGSMRKGLPEKSINTEKGPREKRPPLLVDVPR